MDEQDFPELSLDELRVIAAKIKLEETRVSSIVFSLIQAFDLGLEGEVEAILDEVAASGPGDMRQLVSALSGMFAGMLSVTASLSGQTPQDILRGLALMNQQAAVVAEAMLLS